MADKYRIFGKTNANSGEALYLLEVEVKRSLLVSGADMQQIFAALRESNQDGGWSEVIKLVESGFQDDIDPREVSLVQSPWLHANFSNQNLHGLILALSAQDEDLAFHGSGSPESGGITFTANISGRQYSRTVRSSVEAKAYAEDIIELRGIAIAAGWKGKVIDKLATLIDWLLRAVGVYELAEKAWEKMQERIEAEKQQRQFERELLEHIDRERSSGIDRGREFDMAERISRTA